MIISPEAAFATAQNSFAGVRIRNPSSARSSKSRKSVQCPTSNVQCPGIQRPPSIFTTSTSRIFGQDSHWTFLGTPVDLDPCGGMRRGLKASEISHFVQYSTLILSLRVGLWSPAQNPFVSAQTIRMFQLHASLGSWCLCYTGRQGG